MVGYIWGDDRHLVGPRIRTVACRINRLITGVECPTAILCRNFRAVSTRLPSRDTKTRKAVVTAGSWPAFLPKMHTPKGADYRAEDFNKGAYIGTRKSAACG